MANGQNIREFTMFMASTGPTWMSGEREIINDFGRSSYLLQPWLSGKNIDREVLKPGHEFTDTIYLDGIGNFVFTGANPEFTVTQEQTGSTWSVPFAEGVGYVTWAESTVEQNSNGRDKGGRTLAYKDLRYQLHQNLRQTTLDRIENVFLINKPNTADSEAVTPTNDRIPLSIHAAINEFNTDADTYVDTADGTTAGRVRGLGGAGLVPGLADANGTAWTTFQRLNPTDANKLNWRPHQRTYGTYRSAIASEAERLEAMDLFVQFSMACKNTELHKPPGGMDGAGMPGIPSVFYTSYAGEAYFENLCRVSQDQFRGMAAGSGQDPHYPGPSFNKVPIIGVDGFSEVAIYPNAEPAVTVHTELSSSTLHTGPRYIGLNGRAVVLGFNKDNLFALREPQNMGPAGKPKSWVQYLTVNMVCFYRSRRRHAHIRPNLTANA